MPPTIGVVIPCYKNHIPQLGRLLWSINSQTHLPDMVVVSCSSSEDSDVLYREEDYKFPLKIFTHKERLNAAQNRNFGTQQINTDIVSYIDGDDIMHPQRIEIIDKAFTTYPDIKLLLHSLSILVDDFKFPKYNVTEVDFEKSAFYVCRWGSVCHKHDIKMRIMNSCCSIPKNVFNEIQYSETSENIGKEDTVFNATIINRYENNAYYCKYDLTWYFPNGSYASLK
jgi:glycosyltransferase involved in cell wall biosynthesis